MKKVISLVLTVVMLLTMAVPSFASEADESSAYDGYSVIIVRGIVFAGLTYEDGTKALQFSVADIIPLLIKAVYTRFGLSSKDLLIESAIDVAYDVLSPIACDKEGNSVQPISMVQYHGPLSEHPDFVASLPSGAEEGIAKTAIKKYGAENTYFFTYDWRKTPQQIAEELNGFVETAKERSGKDKVNIICASMGCMVTTAYMYYYGADSINSAVYLSGAHNGTYVCGDALNGRIVFESEVLIETLSNLTNNLLLKVLLPVFDSLGAFDMLVDLANGIVTDSFDMANDRVLRDCFGTLCGFWALCPDDDFESGVQTIFGGHEDEYPVLLEKIAGTKEFVFSTEETLVNAKNSGVKISFVSNYNKALLPLYERADSNGDGVLESELTSNFATFAPLGGKLSEEYIESRDPMYISADKVVDASTALFPDNTWFVKDAPHVAADYKTEFSDFTFALLESEVQPEITMFEEYPQFMFADTMLNLYPLS